MRDLQVILHLHAGYERDRGLANIGNTAQLVLLLHGEKSRGNYRNVVSQNVC